MSEHWIIIEEKGFYKNLTGTFSHRNTYLLLGFHPLTKEKLHEYGPFGSFDEVDLFATEHFISLERPQ